MKFMTNKIWSGTFLEKTAYSVKGNSLWCQRSWKDRRLNREKDGEIDSFIIEVPAEKIRVNKAKTKGAVAVGVDANISKSDNVKGEVEGVDPVDDFMEIGGYVRRQRVTQRCGHRR